jgi:glycosyltransferase involved in cell wall biosynthesis
MKISILLPYKENFSPNYAGAVSLFVKDTSKISKYKKNIYIYGNTKFKKTFALKYINLDLNKAFIESQSEKYIEKFAKEEKKFSSDVIEIHNRPTYLFYLIKENIRDVKYVIYFHNDPLSMRGSKTIKERIFLLENCGNIIFNSQWSKKRFLEGIESKYYNSEKLIIIYQSSIKQKINFNKKKKWITFVGKLNRAKGYDIFGKTIIKILNKYKKWKAIVIGDERREIMKFYHKNLNLMGFQSHNTVLKILKKTSIAVACSRWNEPLGRTSLEASSNGCAVIISNRGGLPETITNGIILKQLDESELFKEIEFLIKNNSIRKKYQKLSNKNFIHTNIKSSSEVDKYRDILLGNFNLKTKKTINSLRILHVTNFNERHNGRLFFNTGRRINNGFIRLGHSVLEFSDRDVQKYNKSLNDLDGSKSLNNKLIEVCNNFRPNLIVLGHADLVNINTLADIKKNNPEVRIAQWFLDPLNKKGPDFDKNKSRILDKIDLIDASFLTTAPNVLNFIDKRQNFYFIPNPTDPSFETLNNYSKYCEMDVFYAISHGVHRGKLKAGKYDERQDFLESLIQSIPGVKFDIYGLNKIQPIWGDSFLKSISNSKMGLNLSRGDPIKYYSSDRIAQIVGNGLLNLIDERTLYRDFFSDKEMIFYKDVDDLSSKILKYKNDDKDRKKIAEKGKIKYTKYFNSNLVADYIINNTFNKSYKKKKYLWENK